MRVRNIVLAVVASVAIGAPVAIVTAPASVDHAARASWDQGHRTAAPAPGRASWDQ